MSSPIRVIKFIDFISYAVSFCDAYTSAYERKILIIDAEQGEVCKLGERTKQKEHRSDFGLSFFHIVTSTLNYNYVFSI